MKFVTGGIPTLQLLCRGTKQWGIYLSYDSQYGGWLEAKKAAPCLAHVRAKRILEEECGYVLFNSETEMSTCFDSIVGDEGPTKTNPYKGPARVYAVTCNPQGRLLNENT